MTKGNFALNTLFFHYHSIFFLLTLSTQSLLLTTLSKKPFENVVGKGENAGKQHFLLSYSFHNNS